MEFIHNLIGASIFLGSPEEPEIYQCLICDKQFGKKYNLKSHYNVHKNKETNSYSCEVCNEKFKRKHDLTRHLKIHFNSKNYGCPKCNLSFSRLDALKRHNSTKKCRGSMSP